MSWQYRHELGDPCLVLQRKQEREARSRQGKQDKAKAGLGALFEGEAMTQDESEQVEGLLQTWYDHEDSYRPALGAPRVSPSCRGHDSGEVFRDAEDRDALLARLTAESVEACVDGLALIHRVAIQNAMRNKTAGAAVFRHPMLGTPEQAHGLYQAAKAAILPGMKSKGLV